MRIAYLCADDGIPLGGRKGASVHLRSLSSALARRGHQLLLACRRTDGEDATVAGVDVARLPAGDEQMAWLRGALREFRADALLERYSLSTGPAPAVAAKLGIPYVLELNAPLVAEAIRHRGLRDPDGRLAERERNLIATAGRIIGVSSALAEHAVACGAAATQVTVIPNGVDVAAFRNRDGRPVRERYGLSGVVIGFAGSLKPWHGVRALVEATARMTAPVSLLIVGDGPEREAIREASRRLAPGQRAELTGAVAHDRVPDFLAAMDIGAAPFEPQPGFYFSPLKIAEYLAAGLPIVGTSQGDLPSMVGEAGVLVAPGNVSELSNAIDGLVREPSARARMSQAARRLAERMSWEHVAEKVEAVLAGEPVPA
jgi:glycosyltransferase involved in cell wall biosynthesis